MKTYLITESSEPLREGCLTNKGVIYMISDTPTGPCYTTNYGYSDYFGLKHLKCIEVEYFYPDITQSKEITDPAELQKIWEAIRREEPKKEWKLAYLEWQNFTLKEGTYQVDIDDILPEGVTCMNELMHGEVLPCDELSDEMVMHLIEMKYHGHSRKQLDNLVKEYPWCELPSLVKGVWNLAKTGYWFGSKVLPDNNGWISVEERLPDHGKSVLIHYQNYYKKGRTINGCYIPKFFEECDEDIDDLDYDEENDKYYLPEGWYEEMDNWDYGLIRVSEGKPSHWQPLPQPPRL